MIINCRIRLRKNNALCSVKPKEVEVAVREIEQFLEEYRRK